jgi:hypothetical protein
MQKNKISTMLLLLLTTCQLLPLITCGIKNVVLRLLPETLSFACMTVGKRPIEHEVIHLIQDSEKPLL